MATNTTTFHHDLLGKLTGIKVNHQVTQFLGVKYASVKERFADSVLFEQGVENATKFGYVRFSTYLQLASSDH